MATYIDVFEEVILESQMRGMAGDWHKLWRRLDLLSKRVRKREAEGARAPEWAYRLEQKLLTEVLRKWLLPAVLNDLIQNLRSQGERGAADLGIWAALDQEITEQHRMRQFSADAAVLAALKHHAKKPSHVHEGLRALEDLHEVNECLDPQLNGELLVNEGRYIAAASLGFRIRLRACSGSCAPRHCREERNPAASTFKSKAFETLQSGSPSVLRSMASCLPKLESPPAHYEC